MPGKGALTFRELTASPQDRAGLRRFHDEVYAPEFPDPDEKESLANIERYLELKAAGWYGANAYHVVLAESEGEVIGGAIADYLADPNAGVIEFLVVAPAWRSHGIGRRLLDRTEASLDADARGACGHGPGWIVAEIDDPFRVDLSAGNLDPFLRARVWGGWGYRKLDFPYVQPALSAAQQPVQHLLLAAKPLAAELQASLPAAHVVETLRAYLRWAMRIPEPDVNAEYQAMRDHLARSERVALVGLDRYVGHGAGAPVVTEVEADSPDLDAVVRVYEQAFAPDATAAEAPAFRRAVVARRASGDAGYHLWALRAAPGTPVAGMASFFALPTMGFGGYIALAEGLHGRLRSVVARIEEQMRRDRPQARGWLIECTPDAEGVRVFSRLGFREVALDYRQPLLPGAPAQETPRLWLAYKDFGAAQPSPRVRVQDLRAALLEVYRTVYGIAAPELSPLYLSLDTQMRAWPSDVVPWRPPV